jgi:hypothetical protein
MSDQTSEAFAYFRREYNDVKGRVELQRHVVAQLHMVEAEAGEAEAALNALLDDEACKAAHLGLLAKVVRRQTGRNATGVLNIACCATRQPIDRRPVRQRRGTFKDRITRRVISFWAFKMGSA